MAKERVLLVDGNDYHRLIFSEELMDAGYDVIAVATGEDAQNHVQRNGIDLVLIDPYLPDMEPLDVLRKIKLRKPMLPVIVYGNTNSCPKSLEDHADAYVVKASDPTPLFKTMRELRYSV